MRRLFSGMTKLQKKFLFAYGIGSFLLFLYSFTQVDLGLTLTRASIVTDIQRAFQYIGYFNRPLSTLLFILLGVIFFTLYILILKAVHHKKISIKALWAIIAVVTLLITFSYTAFSHDIFNYVFDAKILTHYHQNPYEHKALDYPQDPMLSFMHWTHRTYPYGPVWLGVTAPFSFIGLGYFLPTYFLFKLLAGGSYLLTAFAVSRVAKKISEQTEALSLALFALNPLVVFEILVSGHNDLAMMSLVILSTLYLIEKRLLLAFLFLFLSIGVKYATAFLLPLYIVIAFFQKKSIIIPWIPVLKVFVITMSFAVIAVTLRTNFQPWYLLYAIPFAVLIPRFYMVIPLFILSIGALLNYIPYLYMGNWDKPIPTILLTINISAVILSLVVTIVFFYKGRSLSKKAS